MLKSGSALITSGTEAASLWDLLAVTPDANVSDVDAAYARLLSGGHATADARQAWKLLRDEFYLDVYRRYGSIKAVEQAGYFDDGLPYAWNEGPASTSWGDPRWLCTPVDKVRERLKFAAPGQKICVLLTTGSFSPLHKGHLQMLSHSKDYLEQKGWYVAGGYISPSHDAYVSTKYNGTAALSIHHRLQVCHEAIADSDWLMVDPWEAREAPVSLNFSDVYRRLRAYLALHLPQAQLEVFYVYGSDNAGFTMAFHNQGACICVGRDALPAETVLTLNDLAAERPDHIHYIPSQLKLGQYSSTSVRNGAYHQLPDNARQLYESWKAPRVASTGTPSKSLPYLLRDDLDWALAQWNLPPEASQWFIEKLSQLIGRAFAETTLPDESASRRVVILSRARQQEHINTLENQGQRILTLDAGTSASAALRTSRQFRLADGQVFSRVLDASPQSPPLDAQLQRVQPGAYHLVDDDICSGQTMRAIRKALPTSVQITESSSLAEWAFHDVTSPENLPYEYHDIVDARDFLLGANAGGLVVPLPTGTPVRAPYLPPYINLVSRAKLPPSALSWLGPALWALNTEFFVKWAPHLSVEQADEPSQALLGYLGFERSSPMSDVCRWHLVRANTSRCS